jgi:hypothetical protein
MPRTVLALDPAMCERLIDIASRAFAAPLTTVDSLLGCFAQASAAAGGAHPFDRVAPLWSGLELMYPGEKDLQRIDTTGLDPSFASVEWPRGQGICAQLLAFRRQLAHDSWLYQAVRKRLQARPRSRQQKLVVATVLAYAIRSLIVHGRWARANPEHRVAARAAEAWLWQMLERSIEDRVVGTRLPYVRSPATALYGWSGISAYFRPLHHVCVAVCVPPTLKVCLVGRHPLNRCFGGGHLVARAGQDGQKIRGPGSQPKTLGYASIESRRPQFVRSVALKWEREGR